MSFETDTVYDLGAVAGAAVASGFAIGPSGQPQKCRKELCSHSFHHNAMAILRSLWSITYENFWKFRCQETVNVEHPFCAHKTCKLVLNG